MKVHQLIILNFQLDIVTVYAGIIHQLRSLPKLNWLFQIIMNWNDLSDTKVPLLPISILSNITVSTIKNPYWEADSHLRNTPSVTEY
jgi:hypothetical protein